MIARISLIRCVLMTGLFAGALTGFGSDPGSPVKADELRSGQASGNAELTRTHTRTVKQLEDRADEQRADIKALERLIEGKRRELRETESSLTLSRKLLVEMEATSRFHERQRETALKTLLPKEKATQEYLDNLNSRTPSGPATSLDRRIHASELDLTRRDLAKIQAEIKAIREEQTSDTPGRNR